VNRYKNKKFGLNLDRSLEGNASEVIGRFISPRSLRQHAERHAGQGSR